MWSGGVALVGLRYRQGLKVCLRRTGQVSSGRLCSWEYGLFSGICFTIFNVFLSASSHLVSLFLMNYICHRARHYSQTKLFWFLLWSWIPPSLCAFLKMLQACLICQNAVTCFLIDWLWWLPDAQTNWELISLQILILSIYWEHGFLLRWIRKLLTMGEYVWPEEGLL